MQPRQEIDRRNLLCPHFKKPCMKFWESCAFKYEGERLYPDGTRVIVKCCAIFWGADEQVNLTNQINMLRSETGEIKNANVYQAMAMLGHADGKNGLIRMIRNNKQALPEE